LLSYHSLILAANNNNNLIYRIDDGLFYSNYDSILG